MPDSRPAIAPSLYYVDPWAALDWLEKAFGLERTMVLTAPDGSLGHAQMRLGEGMIHIGTEWSERIASPKRVAGKNTQTLHILVPGDLDAHCARARAAGASIESEPEDQFYGDRTYRALDCDGHLWTFFVPVRTVSREEAERESGLKIEGWV